MEVVGVGGVESRGVDASVEKGAEVTLMMNADIARNANFDGVAK